MHTNNDLSISTALGSITIVLTGVLFPGLWKKKIYMQMVMMGAVCDFLGSLGAAFGFPLNDALCKWYAYWVQNIDRGIGGLGGIILLVVSFLCDF